MSVLVIDRKHRNMQAFDPVAAMAAIVRTPLPRDVEGFEAAVAAGKTPLRPTIAPQLLPGPTARQIRQPQKWVLLGTFVWFPVLLLIKGPLDEINEWIVLVLAFGYIALLLHTLFSRNGPFRSKLLLEMQAGYTTVPVDAGKFWGSDVTGRKTKASVLWDCSGCWVLSSNGDVISEPDFTTDPPGVYPSPRGPAERAVWTGVEWLLFDPDRLGE